jgi:molybdopterin-synthase adenylyltransferase
VTEMTAPVVTGRYAKQILFRDIGVEGQARIAQSRVAVMGLGALGTVIATQLVRAGVGYLRLIDRDFVELGNLQRQVLFTEQDAAERQPKVMAAAQALAAVNGETTIDARLEDVTAANVEELLSGVDLVVDGTDNLEVRFLVNDTCVKAGIPWIYGGALGSRGSTMTIVPGDTACLRCLIDTPPPPGTLRSCDTDGVLAMTTGVIASLESAEALRVLTGKAPRRTLVNLDVWDLDLQHVVVDRREDCPTCVERRFDYLEGEQVSWTTVLCGRNSVQIVPPGEVEIPLETLGRRLAQVAEVSYNGFLLSVIAGDHEVVIFPTGRAIVRGTTDESVARTLYARYVGA